MDIESAGLSDGGQLRARNEDALLLRPDRRLFAVADGMGGHLGGHVASRLAVQTLDTRTAGITLDGDVRALADTLVAAARHANRTILEHGRQDPETEGMGTTLTVLAFPTAPGSCAIAHVGDSRAYRFRTGRLEQLTRDHTWIQAQVEAGRIAPEDARGHPYANVLSRVLGMSDVGDADRLVLPVATGDLFLLCSDGLTGMLDDDDIAAILTRGGPAGALVGDLVDEANRRGGLDNITAIIVRAGGPAT
jgi:serine/threonine protein phosphatase PrpC